MGTGYSCSLHFSSRFRDKSFLHRTDFKAGEVQGYTALVRPYIYVAGVKHAAIVHPDRLWIAYLSTCPFERRDDVFGTVIGPWIDYGR